MRHFQVGGAREVRGKVIKMTDATILCDSQRSTVGTIGFCSCLCCDSLAGLE